MCIVAVRLNGTSRHALSLSQSGVVPIQFGAFSETQRRAFAARPFDLCIHAAAQTVFLKLFFEGL